MRTLRLLAILALGVLFANRAVCQIDTTAMPPGKDLRDLYQRAATSHFVLIGTVEKAEGVGRRLSESDKEKMMTPASDGKAIVELPSLGGSLYTIRIETTLCRQREFRIAPVRDSQVPQDSGQVVYVFVPSHGT